MRARAELNDGPPPAAPVGTALRRVWDGEASAYALPLFRVGLAAIVVARTTHWTAPLFAMDHHLWSAAVEYAPSLEHTAEPALFSPLFALLPRLPAPLLELAAHARPWLAVLLLLGVYPRTLAGLLALLGYGLMAIDRYRYFHHLHLLWLSCGLLALCPSHARLSPHALWARRRGRLDPTSPRWPLQLLRLQALLVYAAAGTAKLDTDFLSGRTLRAFEQLGLLGGPRYTAAQLLLGHAGLAWLVTAAELALVPLLALPRTRPRLAGIALGLALHAALANSMVVSTFSAQMALYLMLFLPWEHRNQEWITGRREDGKQL